MLLHHIYSSRSRCKQSGVAAISLALLLLLITSAMLASQYLARWATSASVDVRDQRSSLQRAENAINAFTFLHGRLPCPASSRNGKENCSGKALDWLPVETLGGPDVGKSNHTQALLDVRYGIYKGTGIGSTDPDLGTASEAFVPTLPDKQPVKGYPSIDTGPVVSGLDLCAKLRGLYPSTSNRWALAPQLSGGPGRQDRLHIKYGADGNIVNVAYGLSVKAPRTVVASSAVNKTDLLFVNPDRSSQLAELVKVVDVHSLYRSMGCAVSMASLDLLATARSWTYNVQSLQQSAIASSVDAMPTAASSLFLGGDVASVTNAYFSNFMSDIRLVTAFNKYLSDCFPVPNPFCPSTKMGLDAAFTSLYLSLASIPPSILGLAVDSTNFALKARLSQVAADSPVWSGANAILQQADKQGLSDE